MNKNKFLLIIISVLVNCIYTPIYAETQTATFDFSENSYNFPVCTTISEIVSKRIDVDTKITENGITMTLAPSPYGGENWEPCWYKPYGALYFNYNSSFSLTTIQPNDVIKQVVVTFADGMTGTKSYFIESFKTFKSVNTYTLNNNVGTLDLSSNSFSEIGWYCRNNKIQIKKIEILYEIDPATSVTETIIDDFSIETGSGFINISGNYDSIEIYNISGMLISKNNTNTHCRPGIYIVKANGKAQKVIVK